MSAGFPTCLPHLSRLGAPTPKSSHSEDERPEDYPVVRNMLHRLAGKGAGRGVSGLLPLSQNHPAPRDVSVSGVLGTP